MANITVTLSEPTVSVSTSNISNVAVTETSSTITVSELAAVSNAQIRLAISNTDPVLYDSGTGVISLNNTTLLSGQTTDNLTEGSTNKYFNGKTTDDLPEGTTNKYLTENGLGNIINSFNTSQPIDMTVTGANLTLTQGASNIEILEGNISMDRQGSGTFDLRQQDISLFHNAYANIEGTLGVNLTSTSNGAGTINLTAGNVHLTGRDNTTLGGMYGQVKAEAESNVFLSYGANSSLSLDPADYFLVRSDNLGGLGSPGNVIHADSFGAITFNDSYKFPTADGSANQFLRTDGSGTLTYQNVVVTAGNGLVGGGNTGSVTLDAVGGYGITVNANDIEVTNADIIATSNGAITTFFGDSDNFPFTFAGNLNVNGNIEVDGNLNYRNVEDLYVQDTKITLNANAATDATVEIIANRPVAGSNTLIRWNETSDVWQFTNDGSTFYNIPASTSDLAEGTNLYYTTDRANTAISNFDGNIDTSGTIEATNLTSNADAFVGNDLYLNSAAANGATTATQIYFKRNQLSGESNAYIRWNESADILQWNDGTTTRNFARDTDDLSEGSTNLYYANSLVDAYLTGGVGIDYSAGTIDLANTTVTPGVYGDGTNVPQVTIDAQGRITSASNVAITAGSGTVTSVTAGDGLTQSGNANIDPTLDVVGGFGITVNADNIELANADLTSLSTNVTTTANIQAEYFIANEEFIGDLEGAISEKGYNNTGGTLAKGQPVYINGAQGDQPNIALANAEVSSEMPAVGIVKANISAGNTGQFVVSGVMSYASHGFTTGAELFVNGAGALQETAPTGEANLIQKIGKALGPNHILVQGAGRTNATPNLNDGNFFLGNASNQAVSADFTDESNTAIQGYLPNTNVAISSDSSITTTSSLESDSFTITDNNQTGTVMTHSSGNVFFSVSPQSAFSGSNVHINTGGFNFNNLKVGYGDTSVIPHVGSFYSGPGILTQNLHVENALNFAKGVVNLNLFADGSATLGNADYKFSDQSQSLSNVYINIGTGNVDGTANTVVGIKTNLNSNTRLGWHDPISRTTYDYQSEPVYDASTAPNGWYAFGDLAKTTVDETFDANLTISGHTALKGFNETVVALGSQSGNIAALAAFNAANGSIFTMTATGGIEISQIPNAVAGSSYTLKITQDGTGSHALTSTFKYQGGDKTLTTAAGNTDIISVVYDGTDYLATLSKDYY